MVSFTDMEPAVVAAATQDQIAFFDQLRQDFEYKVYDFDSPPNLREHLQGLGFVQQDEEAFLVLESALWKTPGGSIDGLTIERITDPSKLPDYVAAEQAIWPEGNSSWRLQQYTDMLGSDPDAVSIYCAYLNGRPVGTGRVSFPPRSRFVDLNGGGVHASMRGRGIFTALLARRIEEARARGYEWVSVDAAPMSRPILLRKGFQHVCWTYPMLHRFERSAEPA